MVFLVPLPDWIAPRVAGSPQVSPHLSSSDGDASIEHVVPTPFARIPAKGCEGFGAFGVAWALPNVARRFGPSPFRRSEEAVSGFRLAIEIVPLANGDPPVELLVAAYRASVLRPIALVLTGVRAHDVDRCLDAEVERPQVDLL